jgi:hypothetical protein
MEVLKMENKVVVKREVKTEVKSLDWVLNNLHDGVMLEDNSTGFRFKYRDSDLRGLVDSFLIEGVLQPLTFVCGEIDSQLMLIDGLGRLTALRKISRDYPEVMLELAKSDVSLVVYPNLTRDDCVKLHLKLNSSFNSSSVPALYMRDCDANGLLKLKTKEGVYQLLQALVCMDNDPDSLWYGRWSVGGKYDLKDLKDCKGCTMLDFVVGVLPLINYLEGRGVKLSSDWSLQSQGKDLAELLDYLWSCIRGKWCKAFTPDWNARVGYLRKYVIMDKQGVGGLSRYLVLRFKGVKEIDDLKFLLQLFIREVNLSSEVWLEQEQISKYTNAGGYNIIAHMLNDSVSRFGYLDGI